MSFLFFLGLLGDCFRFKKQLKNIRVFRGTYIVDLCLLFLNFRLQCVVLVGLIQFLVLSLLNLNAKVFYLRLCLLIFKIASGDI